MGIVGRGFDKQARIAIWEFDSASRTASLARSWPIEEAGGRGRGIQFLPDVAIHSSPSVSIVNLATEEVESSFPGNYWDFSVSSDGGRLAVVEDDDGFNLPKVLDIATGKTLLKLDPQAHLRPVRLSPDNRYIATADHASLRLWDASDGKQICSLTTGYCNPAFSPDSQKLVTLSHGGVIKIWDVDRIVELHHPFGSGARLVGFVPGQLVFNEVSAAWASDSTHIALLSDHAITQVWNTATRQLEFTLQRAGESATATALDWSKDGAWIVTAVDLPDQEGVLRIWERTWDAERWQGIRELREHDGHTPAIGFSPDRRWLAAGYWDRLLIWDTVEWTCRDLLKGELFGTIEDVEFSPDGQELAAVAHDGALRIVEVDSGRQLVKHRCGVKHPLRSTPIPYSVAYSPDGSNLAIGQFGGFTVIDRETQAEVLRNLDDVEFRYISYSPDGRRLLTGRSNTAGETAKIWDAITGEELLRLPAPQGVNALTPCFSTDGRKIFIGGPGAGKAMVFHAATDHEIEQREALFANYERRKEQARQARQADEGAIKKWLALGPIPNGDRRNAREAVNHVFLANEANLRPKPSDAVIIADEEIAWKTVELDDYRFNAAEVFPIREVKTPETAPRTPSRTSRATGIRKSK